MKIDLEVHGCGKRNVKICIAISSLLGKLKFSEDQNPQFHRNFVNIFIGVVCNLKEQSVLKYKMTKAVSALNPYLIYSN